MRLVVGQSATFALCGIVIGGVLALFSSRWLQPLLYRQSATDLGVYATVGALMLGVALLASALPALRAVKADPLRSLRAE